MNRIIIIVVTILSINCKAQSPIMPLNEWGEEQINAYYKDLDNDLDDFVGTWIYTEGNTTLKIKLKKEVMHFNGKYFEDLIVGEYQYIKNGVELINTLGDINSLEAYEHNIFGQNIYNSCIPFPASDCEDGEIRLDLSVFDTLVNYSYDFLFHKRIVNGEPALKAFNVCYYHDTVPIGTEPPEPTLPCQNEIILMKVE